MFQLLNIYYIILQIFVATTIFLPAIPFLFAGGAASKIFYCKFGGNEEYKGTHFIAPTSLPNFSISLVILLQASSISSSPVRNTKISPASS